MLAVSMRLMLPFNLWKWSMLKPFCMCVILRLIFLMLCLVPLGSQCHWTCIVGSLYDCNCSPSFRPCSLHRGLINLTPGDGFPSQTSSEVMGICSVTNGGAGTELAPLGVQVVLHFPCPLETHANSCTHMCKPTHTLPLKWPCDLSKIILEFRFETSFFSTY